MSMTVERQKELGLFDKKPLWWMKRTEPAKIEYGQKPLFRNGLWVVVMDNGIWGVSQAGQTFYAINQFDAELLARLLNGKDDTVMIYR